MHLPNAKNANLLQKLWALFMIYRAIKSYILLLYFKPDREQTININNIIAIKGPTKLEHKICRLHVVDMPISIYAITQYDFN